MNQATEIVQAAHNASEATNAAVAANAIADHYAAHEGVVYNFSDKSLIVVHGSKFTAYGSRTEFSTAAIRDWAE